MIDQPMIKVHEESGADLTNPVNVGTLYTDIKFYPELCCEYCGEVIHNHFDCPICKKSYASTDQYGSIEESKTIFCDECDSEFEIIDIDYASGAFNLIAIPKVENEK